MKAVEGFLASHLLWEGCQFGLTQFGYLKKSNTINIAAIPDNLRLGHQIEHIYLELLYDSELYDIIAHSLQLVENKKTLGELDFVIISIQSQKITHIELAYKFYLLDPKMSGPILSLVGPNRSDAFIYKLEKTKTKQMPLLYSEAAKNSLQLDVNNIVQKVAFYGQIFVPYQSESNALGVLNSKCVLGYWLTLDQFIDDFIDFHFYFPLKSEWIYIPHEDVDWQNSQDAILKIKELHIIKRSPMLWVRKGELNIDKIFVTFWK